MELRQPPFLEHLLFENPWPAVAAIAAIGVALLWMSRTRSDSRQAVGGVVMLVMAAILFLVSALVATEREQCLEQTERLVSAITPLRVNEIRTLLEENVTLTAQNEVRQGQSVFDGVEQTAESRFALKSNSIKDAAAESVSDGRVRVLFTLLTIAERGRVTTRWLLDWRRTDEKLWQVAAIEWLPATDAILGIAPNIGYLPRNTTDVP